MKKRALRKDFYMEIKKSLGRFLSIFFIVALGVSFFSGIRASEPDMRLSGDRYFDENQLMDIKVMSTMGLTEDDIKALEELPQISKAEGSYSEDVLCKVEQNMQVLHVMSLTNEMNLVTVEDGRLPEAADECLIDGDFMKASGYQIGDMIELESGTEESLGETLKTTRFTIVGSGSSPYYVSYERGSSTIGTGEVKGFLMVPESAFDMEVYTEIYLQAVGAGEETAFTKGYEKIIDSAVEQVESIEEVRCNARRQEIVDRAQAEVDEAKDELEEKRTEALEKLNESEKELIDGERTFQEGKDKIASGKQEIANAKTELETQKMMLEEGASAYESGMEQLEKGKQELEEKTAQFEEETEGALIEIEEGEKVIDEQEAQFNQAKEFWVSLKARMEAQREALNLWRTEIDELEEAYAQYIESPDYDEEEAIAMKTEIDLQNAEYQIQKTIFEYGEKLFEMFYEPIWEKFQEAEEQIRQAREQLGDARAKIEAGALELSKVREMIAENEKKLLETKEQIDAGMKQIVDGEVLLKEKEAELIKGEKEFLAGEAELLSGREKLEKAKNVFQKEIEEAEQKIWDAEQEITEIAYPQWYVFDRGSLPSYSEYGENADRMRAIGQVFPSVFFLVAALISLTTMTRMVEEQRTQIGTLKALGYSKGSIIKKYLNYALLATLGGSIFGVLFGEKVFPYIIVFAYKIVYTHIPHIIVPYHLDYAVTATILAVLCTTAATLFSCYKELLSQPAVLMRPESPKQGKRIILERITFIWRHLNFSWKSSLRNLFRYKKRLFMTVFGIGGCMSLLLVGFGLKDSIMSIADLQYSNLQTYVASVYMQEGIEEEERASLETYLKNETDILGYKDVYMKNVTLEKGNAEKEVYLMIPKDLNEIDEFLTLKNRTTGEKYQISDDGVILTEKAADMLRAGIGDKVSLNGKQIQVIGVCENYMGHYAYITSGLYEEIYGAKPVYNSILIKSEVSHKELQEIGSNILAHDGVMNVQYTDNMKEQIENMLGSLNIVIVVLIIAAGMLAFVVLYNLNNININERKRELATIKVLGFYDLEVAEYVYRENILLTLMGAVVGCGLGNLLHRFIIVTVEVEAVMFARTIFWQSYLYSILFTIGFSAFVNWVMYFKLKKINMVESLKSVE